MRWPAADWLVIGLIVFLTAFLSLNGWAYFHG
ncbi:MAG: hypothetical protein RLZZ104_2043 [Pseudomonadota bacterium]|jgi:hypothetical protein